MIPNDNIAARGTRDEIFLTAERSGWAERRSVDCASAHAAHAFCCSVRTSRMVLHKGIEISKKIHFGRVDTRNGRPWYLEGRCHDVAMMGGAVRGDEDEGKGRDGKGMIA